jgi:uncharacterized damage-inducible protein DinB
VITHAFHHKGQIVALVCESRYPHPARRGSATARR